MTNRKAAGPESEDLFKRIPAIEDAIEEFGKGLDQLGQPRLAGMAPGFRRGAMWMHSKMFAEIRSAEARARAEAYEEAAQLCREAFTLDNEAIAIALKARASESAAAKPPTEP